MKTIQINSAQSDLDVKAIVLIQREEKIDQAVKCYIDRQSREQHPSGKFDNGGRWFPVNDERQPCCDGIRKPSGNWPYSLMLHCRTAAHIAHLYDVDIHDLRKRINAEKKANSEMIKASISDSI